MPRATWKGFLRLSLVTCPVYLVPAATKSKAIRLHQIRMPTEPEPEIEEDDAERPLSRSASRLPDSPRAAARFDAPAALRPPAALPSSADAPAIGTATRIALQPVDRDTGELLERSQVARGYEFDRGQFVTLTPEELKSLDLESSHTIDLTSFVPRAEVDPVYFNAPYYVHPDGRIAAEAFRVIGAAMAEAGVAGIGCVTMARRERQVIVEPRGAGMVLITLRAGDEVRPAKFGDATGDLDREMVAVAEAIIQRRTASFDPSTFRDRYQDALQELIQAKLKGRIGAPAPAAVPAPVIDLMDALKRSLMAEGAPPAKSKAPKRVKVDRAQPQLLMPVQGGAKGRKVATDTKAPPAAAPPARRKKAS